MKMQTIWKGALLAAGLTVGAGMIAPGDASAFCGFYVAGGESSLFNDATQVVLMRDGTKTILSMQNNYQGPTKKFAMVVPVPEVLMEENVKTLPAELFAKVDQLTAPRLVEYWEQDPCQPDYYSNNDLAQAPNPEGGSSNNENANDGDPAVKIEAEFSVGEYDIVILSATEANALDTWLKDNSYSIPAGAAPLFEQYIQQGMYFFVAKVDPAKVTFKDGRAVLSPLRFDYDSETFSLPVRLGMVNSSGEQDLITYILGRNQRYEVANYPNAFIPTNIEVSGDVKADFGTFYTKLFARTVKQNPGAVVTEYAWDASTCDPCPGPTLDPEDYATFGADVLGGESEQEFFRGWTVTRLHARYGKDGLTDDLVFKSAPAVVGGRERVDERGRLETGAKLEAGGSDNFQGRYIVRNRWTGAVNCEEPVYGNWGGPPGNPGGLPQPSPALSPNTLGQPAAITDGGSLEDRDLETLVKEDIDDLDVKARHEADGEIGGSGCSAAGGAGGGAGVMLALLGLVGLRRRKRA